MADANRKLLALKFAYQILTDSHSSARYCFSRLRDGAGDIVDYYQMLDLLNEIAADLKNRESPKMLDIPQEVLRTFKPGDKVVKNNRYYVPEGEKGREYVVSSEPRMLCDTLVVEISCGTRRDPAYSVDGLDLVESGGAE